MAILADRSPIEAADNPGQWWCIRLTRQEEITRWDEENNYLDHWVEWVKDEAVVELASGETPDSYAAEHFPEWAVTNAFPTFKPVPLPSGVWVPF